MHFKLKHSSVGLAGISLFIIFILTFFFIDKLSNKITYLEVFSALSFLFVILIKLLGNINRSFSEVYFTFFIVVCLFHLGIPIGKLFGEVPLYYRNYLDKWYYNENIITSFLYILLFIFFYLLSDFLSINLDNTKKHEITELEFNFFQNFNIYSLFFLILIWIFVVKIYLKIDTYSSYHQALSGMSLFYSIFNTLIGFVFILNCYSIRYGKIALLSFLFWGMFALPIGLRGEVLFPLAIAVAVLIHNNIIKLNAYKLTSILIVILIVIPVIKETRHSGDYSDFGKVDLNSSLIEMGSSIRPIFESINWIENKEVVYYLGQTYIAPFERTISKFIPFYEVPNAYDDQRLMNVVIAEKSGNYGFSIIAESFINFSFIGVMLFGFITGILIKWFDSLLLHNLSIIDFSLKLVIIYSLFFHIRQSFVGSFGTGAICLSFVLVSLVLSRLLIKRTES
jgi:oligosaccharide repeat unit polymerase